MSTLLGSPPWDDITVVVMRELFNRGISSIPELMGDFGGSKWQGGACGTGRPYRGFGGPLTPAIRGKGRVRRGPLRSFVETFRKEWRSGKWSSKRQMARAHKM